MKVLITGGRDYNDYGVICQTLDELRINKNKEGIDIELIIDNNLGVGRLARIWADVNKISCTTLPTQNLALPASV